MILEQEVLILVTVTYEFYKDSYGGVLNENLFNKSLLKATRLVSNRTNNKIDSISDDDENQNLVNDIRLCICNVVDKVQYYNTSNGKVVSSQSSGKISESYVVDSSKASAENDIADVIKMWLSGYGYTNFVWI